MEFELVEVSSIFYSLIMDIAYALLFMSIIFGDIKMYCKIIIV